MCVYQFLRLSVCVSVSQVIRVSVSFSGYPCVRQFLRLSVCVSVYQVIRVSVSFSRYPCVRQFLRLSVAGSQQSSAEVISLMTVDVQRVADVLSEANVGFELLIYLPVILVILWQSVGVVAILGMTILCLLVAICSVLSGKVGHRLKVRYTSLLY